MATALVDLTPTMTEVDSAAMTLSPTAENKLRDLLVARNIPNHGLRVFVSGGGCSGLQYGMAFEAQARDFDTVVNQNGVKLFLDPTSLMYLAGGCREANSTSYEGEAFDVSCRFPR